MRATSYTANFSIFITNTQRCVTGVTWPEHESVAQRDIIHSIRFSNDGDTTIGVLVIEGLLKEVANARKMRLCRKTDAIVYRDVRLRMRLRMRSRSRFALNTD
jgi:hypothetical protein